MHGIHMQVQTKYQRLKVEARRHSARQMLTLRDMPERHDQGPELCIGTFGLKPPGPGHVWCWVDDPDQLETAAPEGTPCMCVCVTLHPSPCTTASNADGLMRRAQPVGMLIANSESAGSSAAQYGSKLGVHQRLLQAASSYRHGIKAKPGCLCLCLCLPACLPALSYTLPHAMALLGLQRQQTLHVLRSRLSHHQQAWCMVMPLSFFASRTTEINFNFELPHLPRCLVHAPRI